MKTRTKIFILFIIAASAQWAVPEKAVAQVSVSFQVFYDDLSPYGTWVDNTNYGYVWVPNVGPGFTPYATNGHWVYTDAGWTWFSDYAWGWAPFHYGRWFYDPVYGSMWVPGDEWGPGWVSWRRSEGYYGWAPIEPGISISIAYSSGYNIPHDRWTFVRDRDFGRTNMNNYYVNRTTNTTIINNSTVINNINTDNSRNVKYNSGPDRTEVQKQTGKTIAPVALRESNKPGQRLSNNELQLYRPRMEKNSAEEKKPTPAKVASLKDVKPAAQRSAGNQPKRENQLNKEQPTKQPGTVQPTKQNSKQQQRSDQPAKQNPSQQPRNNQPAKENPSQPRNEQPIKQNPSRPQHNTQPAKQNPAQQQPNNQPNREQPEQRNDHPARLQPLQPQDNIKSNKEQPTQQQRKVQPAEQKRNDGPPRLQPLKPKQNVQPNKERPSQQKPDKPAEQQRNDQRSRNEQASPLNKTGGENPKQQNDPMPNKEDEKRPH